jgi:hypothetical protein
LRSARSAELRVVGEIGSAHRTVSKLGAGHGAVLELSLADGIARLTFSNGWTNYGGIWETAAYRKDQLGIVHVRGLVTKGDGTPVPSLIAVLPVGYRPQRGRIFAVHTGEAPHAVGRISVLADGQLTWGSGATGEQDYTSLDTISFDTD